MKLVAVREAHELQEVVGVESANHNLWTRGARDGRVGRAVGAGIVGDIVGGNPRVPAQLGRRAAVILFEHLCGTSKIAERLILKGELVVRESSAALPSVDGRTRQLATRVARRRLAPVA